MFCIKCRSVRLLDLYLSKQNIPKVLKSYFGPVFNQSTPTMGWLIDSGSRQAFRKFTIAKQQIQTYVKCG